MSSRSATSFQVPFASATTCVRMLAPGSGSLSAWIASMSPSAVAIEYDFARLLTWTTVPS